MTPLRRARLGTTLTFGLAAAIEAVWIVRTPALVDKLRLDPGSLGVIVLVWGLGALLSMQLSRHLFARVGTRTALRVAGPASTALLAPIGLADSYPLFLVAAAVFGMAFGLLDIAMNTQASAIERAYDRHLMNGMHAGWSTGAVVGGLAGSLTAAQHWSFTASIVGAAIVSTPIAIALGPTYLSAAEEARDAPAPRRGRLPGTVYLVAVIAFAAFMVEGSVADWSGIHLHTDLHATEGVAALGYPALEVGALGGRLVGDRVRTAIGTRPLIMASGLATAGTLGIVVVAGHAWIGLLGYLLTGVAVCTIAPVAFSVAGEVDPARAAAAIAVTGTAGYTGLLLGPVVIGLLAEATTLSAALLVAVALGVVIAVGGRLLPNRWRVRGHDGTRPPEPAGADAAG